MEDLQKKLFMRKDELREQLDQVQKKLDLLDYKDRFAEAKQYEGKYFIENDQDAKKFVRCVFVFGVNEKNCNMKVIGFNYYCDSNEYFQIENPLHFDPKSEDINWNEISKKEFDKHRSEVMKRIELALSHK